MSTGNLLVTSDGTSTLVHFGLAGPSGSSGTGGTAACRRPPTPPQPAPADGDVVDMPVQHDAGSTSGGKRLLAIGAAAVHVLAAISGAAIAIGNGSQNSANACAEPINGGVARA